MYRRPIPLRIGTQGVFRMLSPPRLQLVVAHGVTRDSYAPKPFGVKPKANLRIVPKIEVGHADEVLPPAVFKPMQDPETSTPVVAPVPRDVWPSRIIIEDDDDDEILVTHHDASEAPRRGWVKNWIFDSTVRKITVSGYVLQDYLRHVVGDDRTIRYYLNQMARDLARNDLACRHDSRRDLIFLVENRMLNDLMELVKRYGRWVPQDVPPGLRAIRFSDNQRKNYVVTINVATRTFERVYTADKFERFMRSSRRSPYKRRLVNTARRHGRRFVA